jgi:hypothetical protein
MAQIKTILCALDFSEVSPKVAAYSKFLAEACGAKVVALYVAPFLDPVCGVPRPGQLY